MPRHIDANEALIYHRCVRGVEANTMTTHMNYFGTDQDLTPAQKMNKAKKHYVGALHHSVFNDRTSKRINTNSPCWDITDGVSTTEAQILVANKMALMRMADDGSIWLSETLHGAKQSGKHRALTVMKSGSPTTISSYSRSAPVDMKAVWDTCTQYAYRFNMGKMY